MMEKAIAQRGHAGKIRRGANAARTPSGRQIVCEADGKKPEAQMLQRAERRQLLLLMSIGAAAAAAIPGGRAHAAEEAGGAQEAVPSVKKVFVSGATGKTGRRVVQQLRQRGFLVTAGCRDVKKGEALGFGLDDGISLVQADLTGDVATLAAAIGSADAVVCAAGNAFSAQAVDGEGTRKLIDATKSTGPKPFVLVSSVLSNGRAIGQQWNPNFIGLNLFGGVLDVKLSSELYLRASGLPYTIIRPGGLSDNPPEQMGSVLVLPEDTLRALPSDPGIEISRDSIAALCVEALLQPAASNRVVEAVASTSVTGPPQERWYSPA